MLEIHVSHLYIMHDLPPIRNPGPVTVAKGSHKSPEGNLLPSSNKVLLRYELW